MHSLSFPESAGKKGSFHFNSDLSGDIDITVEKPGTTSSISIPGAAMEHFVHMVICRRLSEIDDILASVIIGAIIKP